MAVERYTSYTQSALRLRRVGGPILVGAPPMHNSSFQQKINVFTRKLKWCTCNCNLSTNLPLNGTNLKAKVTENTVALSRKAAKDNVGVVGYEVWTGATPSEMTLEALLSAEQLNYDLTEIPKGTLYYGICAVDAAGNAGSLKALKTTIKTELATPDLAAFAATDLLKWEP